MNDVRDRSFLSGLENRKVSSVWEVCLDVMRGNKQLNVTDTPVTCSNGVKKKKRNISDTEICQQAHIVSSAA